MTSTPPACTAWWASTPAAAAVATPVSSRLTSTPWWRSTAPTPCRARRANLADLPNAVVVRSDLREAPFEDGAFGFIASFGVLHHLSDPRAGFDRLIRLLAPEGVLSLYLYSRPEGGGVRSVGLTASAEMRRVTLRMPHPALKALCTPIAALLWAGVVLPGKVGDTLRVERLSTLPMASYREKPFRSLVTDTFDRLSRADRAPLHLARAGALVRGVGPGGRLAP